MSDDLTARRAAALRALTQRPDVAHPRFPGETQPSDGLPADDETALRILEARHRNLPDPEEQPR